MVQSQSILDWTMSMLQIDNSLDKAISVFSLASDKEIANMASYRALGMNPADAPKFGWGLSDRPRMTVTNQTIIPEQQVPMQPKSKNMLATVLTVLGGGALLGAALTYLSSNTNMTNQTSINKQIEDLKAIIATNKSQSQPKVDISGLQSEICTELDSDPAFAEEIKRDLLIIGAKIKAHKDKRLGISP